MQTTYISPILRKLLPTIRERKLPREAECPYRMSFVEFSRTTTKSAAATIRPRNDLGMFPQAQSLVREKVLRHSMIALEAGRHRPRESVRHPTKINQDLSAWPAANQRRRSAGRLPIHLSLIPVHPLCRLFQPPIPLLRNLLRKDHFANRAPSFQSARRLVQFFRCLLRSPVVWSKQIVAPPAKPERPSDSGSNDVVERWLAQIGAHQPSAGFAQDAFTPSGRSKAELDYRNDPRIYRGGNSLFDRLRAQLDTQGQYLPSAGFGRDAFTPSGRSEDEFDNENNPRIHAGANGLVDRLRALIGAQNQYQPSAGFG